MPPVDTVTVLPSWVWEIDWVNDPSSGTETWTDITAYVRDGATIRRGRQVETGRDQAGTCSLSLDNRDRRFDWYNAPETRNLVLNPSVEPGPTGYNGNFATVNRLAAAAFLGGFGLQVNTTNVVDSGTYRVETEHPITAGLPYTFSLHARRAAVGTGAWYLRIGWYAGATFLSYSTAVITLNSTTFARFQLTGTAPAGATLADLEFATNAAQGIITVYTDAWQFEQTGAASAYCDGSQPGCFWEGAADASVSRRGAPYWPNIKPMRRIRCRATYAAVTYPLFYGYLDSIPMAYPGVADATVQLTATDGFKVLAGKQLTSPENLITNPGAEENLNGYVAYNGSVLTRSDRFALRGDYGTLLQVLGTNDIVMTWEPDKLPEVEAGRTYTFSLLLARNQAGSSAWQARIDWYQSGSLLGSTTASFTVPGTSATRYSVTGTAPANADEARPVLRYNAATGARDMFTDDWRFTTGARPTGSYGAQRTDERIADVLDQIAWPSAKRSLAAGSSQLDSIEVDQISALEHLQQVADSESGRLFMSADGLVKFIDRHAPYLTSSAATFGEQEILYVDVQFAGDEQLVYNDVVVQRAAEGATQKQANDTTSQTAYMPRTLSRSGMLFDNDNESQVKADFELALFKDFHPRIISMTLDGTFQPSTVWPQALGRELGDRLTVRKRPPGGGLIEQISFIEWIEHRVGIGTWETVFGLTSVGIAYLVYPSGKTFFVLGTSALTTGTGVLVY